MSELMTSSDTCPMIEPIFNRTSQITAAIILLLVAGSSIGLQIAFLLGVRTLCGWGSNFAFSILALMSSCSLARMLTEIVATVAVLINLDWCKYEWLWRILGSFAFAPYFTVIILNILLTFHRIAYTIFPLYAGQTLVSSILKILLLLISMFFISFIIIIQLNILDIRFVPNLMIHAFMPTNVGIIVTANAISNYIIGIFNVVCYPIMFCILFIRKNISLRNDKELKMTIQVFVMVVLEFLYFIYWEFLSLQYKTTLCYLVAEIINLSYFDAIVLPYLVMNRAIRAGIRQQSSVKILRITK